MRLYVIGSDGQVARSLRETAPLDENNVFGFSGRAEVDLLKPWSIERALTKFRPDVVVNPAAYTAVDKAESEPDLAFAINRDGARVVAAAAANQGAPVIHLSTDYVFDGKKVGAYVESDPVSPKESMAGQSSKESWPSPKSIPGSSCSERHGSMHRLEAILCEPCFASLRNATGLGW